VDKTKNKKNYMMNPF